MHFPSNNSFRYTQFFLLNKINFLCFILMALYKGFECNFYSTYVCINSGLCLFTTYCFDIDFIVIRNVLKTLFLFSFSFFAIWWCNHAFRQFVRLWPLLSWWLLFLQHFMLPTIYSSFKKAVNQKHGTYNLLLV